MGLIIYATLITAIGIILINFVYEDWAEDIGFFLSILGLVCIIIFVVVIAAVQIPADADLERAVYERKMLEYRLENTGLEGNELLYSDVMDFNKHLYTKKRHAHRFNTGWFVNAKIADNIDYISVGNDIIPGGTK